MCMVSGPRNETAMMIVDDVWKMSTPAQCRGSSRGVVARRWCHVCPVSSLTEGSANKVSSFLPSAAVVTTGDWTIGYFARSFLFCVDFFILAREMLGK